MYKKPTFRFLTIGMLTSPDNFESLSKSGPSKTKQIHMINTEQLLAFNTYAHKPMTSVSNVVTSCLDVNTFSPLARSKRFLDWSEFFDGTRKCWYDTSYKHRTAK